MNEYLSGDKGRAEIKHRDRQERKLRRTAVFLIVALAVAIIAASVVYGQEFLSTLEQASAGPVSKLAIWKIRK